MKTQLGLYRTMELGGSVPNINVPDDVVKKIRGKISMIKFQNSQGDFKQQGRNETEFNYNLCYHDKHKNKLFIICQVKSYEGHKLVGHNFKVYAFDKKGYIVEFDQDKECVNGFYENAYVIKEDLL